MAVDPAAYIKGLLPAPGERRKRKLASRRFKQYRGERRNSLRGSYNKATNTRKVGELRYWRTVYSVWAKRPGQAARLARQARG